MPAEIVKMSKFLYDHYECKDCDYKGPIEIAVPYFDDKVFNTGDKVGDEYVGTVEHFDGFFCPNCLRNKRVEIKGVRIIVEDGIYTRCIFD